MLDFPAAKCNTRAKKSRSNWQSQKSTIESKFSHTLVVNGPKWMSKRVRQTKKQRRSPYLRFLNTYAQKNTTRCCKCVANTSNLYATLKLMLWWMRRCLCLSILCFLFLQCDRVPFATLLHKNTLHIVSLTQSAAVSEVHTCSKNDYARVKSELEFQKEKHNDNSKKTARRDTFDQTDCTYTLHMNMEGSAIVAQRQRRPVPLNIRRKKVACEPR